MVIKRSFNIAVHSLYLVILQFLYKHVNGIATIKQQHKSIQIEHIRRTQRSRVYLSNCRVKN